MCCCWFKENLTFNIRMYDDCVKHLYISGINKTNYVCAWIGLHSKQHMVKMTWDERNRAQERYHEWETINF
jgi:hypothetical protein